MAPKPIQFLVGQQTRRPFVNRFTRYFFTELDKGLGSPWILLAGGGLLSYVSWRIAEAYIAPRREMLAMRPPIQKVPMANIHNAFWGVRSVDRDRMELAPGEGLDTVTLGEASAAPSSFSSSSSSSSSSEMSTPAGLSYAVQSDDVAHENAMRRPQLVHSEPSELRERASADNPTGEVDLVCLELPEYDAKLRDDVYYRSVHYISNSMGTATPGTAAADKAHANKKKVNGKKDGEDSSKQAGGSHSGGSAPGEESYLNFMPARGADVIHGIVKCKGVTALNNCVTYAGSLESEVARKMMLTLAPVHVLRDTGKTFLTTRFTFVKQTPVETLVVGLHGGEVPRWLSSAFPNFNVDVVEPDGALVSLARRFLGFKESSNLQLRVGNPIDFLRCVAADATVGNRVNKDAKHYDLVLIDAIDGAGQLSTQYSRLESLTNLRNAMSDNACVAVAMPNKDANFMYNMVQNWRMAFAGRPVLLVHCYTSPTTILMTFQDNADRGNANMGSVVSVDEFKDLLRAHLSHYGSNRVQFDLTREISADNFTILIPGHVYEVADYLPMGHPELAMLAAMRQQSGGGGKSGSGAGRWGAWLRKSVGGYLTPGQRADLGYTTNGSGGGSRHL